jgi:electron transfer flavoprotein alpha subunit
MFACIARGFGASLGASRPVVDTGHLPAAHLVGQSGTTVRPRLYVAFGISGALQHLAGIGDSTMIVAVNTDRDAPIFDVARYGACADAVEVARHLRSLLPP